jgi:hypothetical protein
LYIANDADFTEWFLLNKFFGEIGTHVLSVVDQEMRDLDCVIGVKSGLTMPMDLRE